MITDRIIIGDYPTHPVLLCSATNCFYNSSAINISKNSQSYWVRLNDLGIDFWINKDCDVGKIVEQALDGKVNSGNLYGLLWREACTADPNGLLATIKVRLHAQRIEGYESAKAELRDWLGV